MGDQSGSPTSEPTEIRFCPECAGYSIVDRDGPIPHTLDCSEPEEESFVPESLLTVERERRQRAEEEAEAAREEAQDLRQLLHQAEDARDSFHAAAKLMRARAQRLAEQFVSANHPASVPDREAE